MKRFSTPSTSHKNNLMRAARWRMAVEIFAGIEIQKWKMLNAIESSNVLSGVILASIDIEYLMPR